MATKVIRVRAELADRLISHGDTYSEALAMLLDRTTPSVTTSNAPVTASELSEGEIQKIANAALNKFDPILQELVR